MVVKLNANLAEQEGKPQGESIADKLVYVGMLDMGVHFFPRSKPGFQYRCMWCMMRDGL